MSNKNVVGIDLGTCFSSIARLDQFGRPEVLPNAEGDQMTPSAVYFGDDGPVTGKEAMKSGSDDPDRLVENAKRYLGSNFPGWTIGGKLITPVDASAHILRKLKNDAEELIGPIAGAVISVPVHFSIQQRELTILAAKRIGLKILGLVNEPIAGALTFILGEQGLAYAALADEQTILVYDLGGGTFDLSIVHYSEEGIDVKAATGELRLGGIDWNQRLVDLIAQRFWDMRGYDIRRDAKMLRKLAENIEDAKRSLSNPKKPWTNVSIRYEGYSESFKITREEFEEISRDLVERTRRLTDSLVRSTVRRWDLLNQVLPVGGATRMPMIREAIRQMCLKTMGEVFGLEPNYRLSPDLAIAQGASLYAGLLAGDGPAGTEWAKQTYVPKMISSHAFGLVVRDHDGKRVNHVLIPAGSRLPAFVTVGVETVRLQQERISLKIVEAEGERFREEDVILRCDINNLPPDLPEGSAFDVELTCETSGLLQIVAKHRDTGRIATARLKRDVSAVGEVVESDSDGADQTREEAAVQEVSERVPELVDPLFGSVPAAADLTQREMSVDNVLQDATELDDPLFGSNPTELDNRDAASLRPEPDHEPVASPETTAPTFPEGVVFEQAVAAYDSVETDTVASERVQADPQDAEVPIPEDLEPIMLELLEDEEAPTLEPVDEMELLPLEPVDDSASQPDQLNDEIEVLPLDDDAAATKPEPVKLTPLSKKKAGEPPPVEMSPPPKTGKLTPLSKRKGRDEPPLPLD